MAEEPDEELAPWPQKSVNLCQGEAHLLRWDVDQRVPAQDTCEGSLVCPGTVQRCRTKVDSREFSASISGELRHRIDATDVRARSVQEVSPMTRTAAYVEHRPHESASPDADLGTQTLGQRVEQQR